MSVMRVVLVMMVLCAGSRAISCPPPQPNPQVPPHPLIWVAVSDLPSLWIGQGTRAVPYTIEEVRFRRVYWWVGVRVDLDHGTFRVGQANPRWWPSVGRAFTIEPQASERVEYTDGGWVFRELGSDDHEWVPLLLLVGLAIAARRMTRTNDDPVVT